MAKRKTEKVQEKPKAEKEEFKFGIDELAEETGLQPASIRVGLRNSDFEREGSRWGWNSQKEFDKVVKFFKERQGRRPDVAPKETEKSEKKGKGGRKKKAA